MELWDDISRKLSNAADYTVKETEKLTSIAKIKYKLTGEKNKLDLLYQSVGKLKYNEYIGEESSQEFYEGLFKQIDEVLAEITSLEKKYAQLKNYKLCSSCGAKIGRDMLYCPKCGTKQDESAAQNTEQNEENS